MRVKKVSFKSFIWNVFSVCCSMVNKIQTWFIIPSLVCLYVNHASQILSNPLNSFVIDIPVFSCHNNASTLHNCSLVSFFRSRHAEKWRMCWNVLIGKDCILKSCHSMLHWIRKYDYQTWRSFLIHSLKNLCSWFALTGKRNKAQAISLNVPFTTI